MNIVTGYTGIKHVTAGNEACQNMGIVGAGDYVLDVGSRLSASIISNNQVRIADGDIFMQGRHATILSGSYDNVEIANGAQGLKRNDIIAARYTMNADTSVESMELTVIQGSAAETASDPELTSGILRDGDTVHEMPLYRVRLDGLTLTAVEPLFTVLDSIQTLKEAIAENTAALGGCCIKTVSSLPASPDANTIYLIREG